MKRNLCGRIGSRLWALQFSPFLALLLELCLAQACGPDSALIIVELESRPDAATSLRLRAELNGKQTVPPDAVPDGVDSFGLLLPAGASGPFLLTADALDSAGCIIAQGRTDTVLMGHERVRMRLMLAALKSPICKPSP